MCDFVFLKQKTGYEMRISDWSSDVCSSDLAGHHCLDEGAPESARQAERKKGPEHGPDPGDDRAPDRPIKHTVREGHELGRKRHKGVEHHEANGSEDTPVAPGEDDVLERLRSEEHTSELQSLMRISYAVFCLKKKNTDTHNTQ